MFANVREHVREHDVRQLLGKVRYVFANTRVREYSFVFVFAKSVDDRPKFLMWFLKRCGPFPQKNLRSRSLTNIFIDINDIGWIFQSFHEKMTTFLPTF